MNNTNLVEKPLLEKPKLDFWQLWNMNFGFLGIQFGFALQNANVSRIFETLGAEIDNIAILWVAAPLTGLLVQPIIGHLSDNMWHPTWGRRRPFFAIGAVLASLALFMMPNSPSLWIAAGMLWILDASINISMEPFRAFVGDMLPEKQRTTGFAMQTFFIGVGAVVASAMPYIFKNYLGFSNEAPKGQIPSTVVWSFYFGGVVFLLAVLWTVFNTKEYSPDEMRKYNGDTEHHEPESLSNLWKDFVNMPTTMMQLAFVQFFSWLALFAMWIYTTSAVTKFIFKAPDSTGALYNEGADWVGIMFAVYNGLSALFAFFFPPFAQATSRKTAHTVGLIFGGLGLISIYFAPNKEFLLVSMVGVGFAWASILTMPYAILAGSLPPQKMGVYMGIFNFFIVIPQIVAAAILGYILKTFFGGEAIYAMVIGGISMLIAAGLVVFVKDEATEIKRNY